MKEALNEEEGMVRLYFNDITNSKPLSREREVALAARIQQGDLQARDELVQANLRFVVDVAKRFLNRGLPLCELIGAGNLGLITAAERFDGAKGFKFISYAVWWIRQSILQTIAEQGRTVRLPLNRLALLSDISRVSQRLRQGQEHPPAIDQIAAELGVSIEMVLDTMTSARNVCSLDRPIEESDTRSLIELLGDTTQESPDAEVLRESTKAVLENMLKSLDARELRILRLYFGLDGEESITLEQIGRILHLTRERVRQLKERALTKLRHPARTPALRALVADPGSARDCR
ncbi:MAG: RNA polymerase sigma factor RpoD/SigA [Candidatus Latescibacteria bacterium]|nr:RNA polymerase sigma factor RpoD/SigA [Candidatus Latescibacterota bacterium]